MTLERRTDMRRLLLLIVFFIVIFSTMFLGISLVYFVNTVKYDGGVVFDYTYPAFIYIVKASLGGSSITSIGLWLYVLSEYRR